MRKAAVPSSTLWVILLIILAIIGSIVILVISVPDLLEGGSALKSFAGTARTKSETALESGLGSVGSSSSSSSDGTGDDGGSDGTGDDGDGDGAGDDGGETLDPECTGKPNGYTWCEDFNDHYGDVSYYDTLKRCVDGQVRTLDCRECVDSIRYFNQDTRNWGDCQFRIAEGPYCAWSYAGAGCYARVHMDWMCGGQLDGERYNFAVVCGDAPHEGYGQDSLIEYLDDLYDGGSWSFFSEDGEEYCEDGGLYITKAWCEWMEGPEMSWDCVSSRCRPDPNGPYTSIDDCMANAPEAICRGGT